ncbi:MAG: type I-C CRISPR-associated endonuclease Cas1c [Candidatus Auribacterota bacterium]|nr:type I-C CRISPR-associated endonuclease Cas1c [Candidatus Auribacterota bacterium]
MKRYLNTLFVTTQGAYLSKEGESVIVSVNRETKLRVPIISLGSIVCFGNVLCSPFLLGFCCKNNVTISFMSKYGRFMARVDGPVSGNVLLRREQYRRADNPEASSKIARAIVIGKIANCRKVLQRSVRDHGECSGVQRIKQMADRVGQHLRKLSQDLTLDEIRGVEGDASRSYFSVFDSMITSQKENFIFRFRNRRPPKDNVNCLLSFIYTILLHDVRSALETVGLDPQVGFLHRDRPGRPSLALDMMEEFRAPFADRLALSLINLKQVRQGGFIESEAGGIHMTDETRKTLLIAYQKRKQDMIEHPFLGEQMQIGLLFHVQALLLVRFLRGDIDGYPPFIWK